MLPVCEDKTQVWTRQEIIDSLTSAASYRLGKKLPEFIKAVQSQEIDLCEHAEMVALLNLLSKDDPVFCQAVA